MKKFNELTKSGKSRRICIMLNKNRNYALECLYDYYRENGDEEILDHIAEYYESYDNNLDHTYIVCDNLYNSIQVGIKS